MNFLRLLALQGDITARASMLLKSRASPDMLSFSLCNKKACNSADEQTPLSNDTIDCVWHWEVGQVKDFQHPLVMSNTVRIITHARWQTDTSPPPTTSGSTLDSFIDPEDGRIAFLRNVGALLLRGLKTEKMTSLLSVLAAFNYNQ